MHIQLQYVTAYYELTSKKQQHNSYAQVCACDFHSLPPSNTPSSISTSRVKNTIAGNKSSHILYLCVKWVFGPKKSAA